MAAGQWSLALDPATPKSIRDLIDYFGHVFVFDTRMDAGISDADMIKDSRWGGVVRIRATPWDVGGANMNTWLGDEDGKGPTYQTTITGTGATFAAFIALLLASVGSVTSGTISAVAGTQTISYGGMTSANPPVSAREAIINLCSIFGAEWRVNKDWTFDAAAVGSSAMFKTTPTAVAMRRSSGRDLSITGLPVTQLDVSIDAEEWFSGSLVQDATGVWTFANGSTSPYKDGHGNNLTTDGWVKRTVSSLTPHASAATLAANLVAAGQVLRNAVTLSTDEFDIGRDVVVGDWIWVYDADGSMVDTTNQVRYRGSTIYPLKLRTLAITWPIERGMGVWYRDKNAVWTDLTNYVLWEQPGVTFEVGAAVRALLTKP